MKTISAPTLARWLQDPERPRPFLLDVREAWEHDVCRIDGSTLVPMGSLPMRLQEVDREIPVVCICHHGARSARVAMWLMHQGFADVYNLSGGVDAWARQVDTAMPIY